jgi:4,5-dihydroxyphthalate decarboxylase
MARLKLSFAVERSERTQPLIDGTIQPEGIELVPVVGDPSEIFWRQLKFNEFDISALSFSSYMIAKSQGSDLIAVPVFPARRFMHTQLFVNTDSGVKEPKDLIGKKIGVGEYQQTAWLWTRWVLEHDFGVSQYKVHWYMERTEELSHGGATGFTPPQGISFHRIPPEKSLASMLLAHELDAAPVHRALQKGTNIIDRSTQNRAAGGDWSKIKPLFLDIFTEGARFVKQHGYVPASHTYVLRGDVHEKYPWVAFSLFKAFVEAKELARQTLAESIPSGLFFGSQFLAKSREIVGSDPFVYGLDGNRRMIEAMIDASFEQGLTARKMTIPELFAASTLEL